MIYLSTDAVTKTILITSVGSWRCWSLFQHLGPRAEETPRTDGQAIKRLTHIHKHILFIYFNYLFYSQLLYLFLTILVPLEMN